MSYEIGIDIMNLKPGPRLGHTEYLFQEQLIEKTVVEQGGREVGFLQRLDEAQRTVAGIRAPFADLWEYDLVWNTNDGPVEWEQYGRVTDMGHAQYLQDGRDQCAPQPCPFACPEEVWEFDAVEEYGLREFDALRDHFEKQYQQTQKACPHQVVPGGYYKTIMSGAIKAFGWDMLLMAAADEERFERVLESIFQLSLHHYQAWAKTSIKVFIAHDDMVWTTGPFLNPDFYRRVIFPRYQQLYRVLKDAGKKVLYISDGNYSAFVDDIAQLGVDGFIFEPCVPLEMMVEKFGKTHVLVGSKVDCRTLTFGTPKEIQAEIDSSLELAMGCPGFIFAVGNHIPANVPLENGLFYFDYLRRHWQR